MKLDPIREERARRMVLDPTTWPMNYLCMKRVGVTFEFGIIASDVKPNHIVITNRQFQPIVTFNSIDELVEANWTVD